MSQSQFRETLAHWSHHIHHLSQSQFTKDISPLEPSYPSLSQSQFRETLAHWSHHIHHLSQSQFRETSAHWSHHIHHLSQSQFTKDKPTGAIISIICPSPSSQKTSAHWSHHIHHCPSPSSGRHYIHHLSQSQFTKDISPLEPSYPSFVPVPVHKRHQPTGAIISIICPSPSSQKTSAHWSHHIHHLSQSQFTKDISPLEPSYPSLSQSQFTKDISPLEPSYPSFVPVPVHKRHQPTGAIISIICPSPSSQKTSPLEPSYPSLSQSQFRETLAHWSHHIHHLSQSQFTKDISPLEPSYPSLSQSQFRETLYPSFVPVPVHKRHQPTGAIISIICPSPSSQKTSAHWSHHIHHLSQSQFTKDISPLEPSYPSLSQSQFTKDISPLEPSYPSFVPVPVHKRHQPTGAIISIICPSPSSQKTSAHWSHHIHHLSQSQFTKDISPLEPSYPSFVPVPVHKRHQPTGAIISIIVPVPVQGDIISIICPSPSSQKTSAHWSHHIHHLSQSQFTKDISPLEPSYPSFVPVPVHKRHQPTGAIISIIVPVPVHKRHQPTGAIISIICPSPSSQKTSAHWSHHIHHLSQSQFTKDISPLEPSYPSLSQSQFTKDISPLEPSYPSFVPVPGTNEILGIRLRRARIALQHHLSSRQRQRDRSTNSRLHRSETVGLGGPAVPRRSVGRIAVSWFVFVAQGGGVGLVVIPPKESVNIVNL